jgi:hypothetical protein
MDAGATEDLGMHFLAVVADFAATIEAIDAVDGCA